MYCKKITDTFKILVTKNLTSKLSIGNDIYYARSTAGTKHQPITSGTKFEL